MSATTPDDFDLQATLVQIERNKVETAKLNSETAKLTAEAAKLGAEQVKFAFESAKLGRDRALLPYLILSPIIGGLIVAVLNYVWK